MTQWASVADGVEAASQRMGGLDVLVSVAGPPAPAVQPNGSGEGEALLRAIDVKAMGYLRCARAAIPYLLDSLAGRIISVCRQHAHVTRSMAATARNGRGTRRVLGVPDRIDDLGVPPSTSVTAFEASWRLGHLVSASQPKVTR